MNARGLIVSLAQRGSVVTIEIDGDPLDFAEARDVVLLTADEAEELRAKAARCDEYEREGEALITDAAAREAFTRGPKERPGSYAVAHAQLARCRAMLTRAIRKFKSSPAYEHATPDDALDYVGGALL